MMINSKKTNTMVFNFTENFKFSPRLFIQGELLQVIEKTRLLGTIITSDLRWEQNTSHIVTKANARMELLRKVGSFGAKVEDLKRTRLITMRSKPDYVEFVLL